MLTICKLHQKQYRILYNQEFREFINRMPELQGDEWDGQLDYKLWKRGDGKLIKALKSYIKESLEESQGLFCAYCGSKLNLTSNAQVEHIAPKGKNRYPKFTFHPSNLVLACGLCNGFEKKETKDNWNTISKLNDNYEACEFSIVHPYLDDPALHFRLGNGNNEITIHHISPQGKRSIEIFKLDEEPQTNARFEHLLFHLYEFDQKYKADADAAINRTGYFGINLDAELIEENSSK